MLDLTKYPLNKKIEVAIDNNGTLTTAELTLKIFAPSQYSKVTELTNAQDDVALAVLATGKPTEYIQSLHPYSLIECINAIKELNKDGYYKYIETQSQNNLNSVLSRTEDEIKKLALIGAFTRNNK